MNGALQRVRSAFEFYLPSFPVPASNGSYVAGGFVRDVLIGREPKDIDIYGSDIPIPKTWKKISEHGKVQTFSANHRIVQICDWKTPPGLLLQQFDFTICAAAMRLDCDEMIFHPLFEADNESKVLRIINLPNPMATLSRMARFMAIGYQPLPETVEALSKSILSRCQYIPREEKQEAPVTEDGPGSECATDFDDGNPAESREAIRRKQDLSEWDPFFDGEPSLCWDEYEKARRAKLAQVGAA